MDYEKKYNEALKRAKAAIDIAADKDLVKGVASTIFPELRESEEERTRKRLIEFISDIKRISESGRTTWAVRKDDAEMCDDFLDYLEKQKDAFENGRQLGIMQEQARQELERTDEKQKEQKPALTPERIHPKFAVGDTVCRPMWSDHTIREIYVRCNDPVYVCVNEEGTESHIPFSEQDEWERKEQKPTWSEEDEKQLDDIISIIRGAYEHGITISETRHRNAYLWLNNLRPSWKPSEEQMDCLCAAVDAAIRKHNESVSGYKPARVLKSLYEQLQKLM